MASSILKFLDQPAYQCRYCKRGEWFQFHLNDGDLCPQHSHPVKYQGVFKELLDSGKIPFTPHYLKQASRKPTIH